MQTGSFNEFIVNVFNNLALCQRELPHVHAAARSAQFKKKKETRNSDQTKGFIV